MRTSWTLWAAMIALTYCCMISIPTATFAADRDVAAATQTEYGAITDHIVVTPASLTATGVNGKVPVVINGHGNTVVIDARTWIIINESRKRGATSTKVVKPLAKSPGKVPKTCEDQYANYQRINASWFGGPIQQE